MLRPRPVCSPEAGSRQISQRFDMLLAHQVVNTKNVHKKTSVHVKVSLLMETHSCPEYMIKAELFL